MIDIIKNFFRPKWKQTFISESDDSTWEILNDTKKKTIELQFVPEDDYSDSDVKILLTYTEFNDLVKFMSSLK